ncbi:MAG: hypothetical protein ACD_60C00087G0008 [uncultured bacterium]|nr:MAG: hypothetical protein ACD_60C00087G0008 [uncultured bacterium]
MTKSKQLTRICTACGMTKPLSAFLQISGTKGTIYGAICSTCRGSGIKEKSNIPAHDEESSTSSSIRIGAKQKVELEKKQKQDYQELKEEQTEEEKKRIEITDEKIENLQNKEKAEKDHREVIEAKKRGFLNYKAKTLPLRSDLAPSQKEGTARTALDDNYIIELNKIEEAFKEEFQKTTVDLSGAPLLDLQHGGTIKRNNPIFEKFKTWLGPEAMFLKTLMRQMQKNPENQAKLSKQEEQKDKSAFLDGKPRPSSSRKR